jgi:hypothetical protein
MNDTEAVGVAEASVRIQGTSLTGEALLERPLLNKGSVFTEEKRRELGLLSLLPPHLADMEEQLVRTYENYERKDTDLERYIFLAELHDRNETVTKTYW